jgi:excisionase family DNA binding protein
MFSGNEFGGNSSTEMARGHDGDDRPTAPSADEIPFEHRLMTKKEISEYFRITERTIEIWMRRRYIPYIKIGQSVRFRVASVLRYVEDKYLVPAGQPRRHAKHRGNPIHCHDARSGPIEVTPHAPWEEAADASDARSGN